MNTNNLGDLGELKVITKLTELGVEVYTPFSKTSKADLIGMYNNHLYKIQVKTSEKSKDEKIVFSLSSSIPKANKKYIKYKYSPEEIDLFLLYNYEKDCIYILPCESPKDTFIIQYDGRKCRQTKNINYEKDFLIDNNFHKYFK
jgi:hypothetical protein